MRRHVLPAEPRLPDARRSPTSAVDICSIGVIAKSAAAATASALANAATRGRHPEVAEKRHSGHDVRWNQAAQQLNRPVRRHQREHRPERDKHNRLGHELANDAHRGRAKRRADRHFTPSTFGADEQQAGDVHGSNHQKESGAAQQHDQHRPNHRRRSRPGAAGRLHPVPDSNRDTPSRAAAQRRSFRPPPTRSTTPSLSRATPKRLWQLRRRSHGFDAWRVTQKSAGSAGAKWKWRGSTPTMTCGAPLSVTDSPSTLARRHSAPATRRSSRARCAAAEGRSSPARKSRPTNGGDSERPKEIVADPCGRNPLGPCSGGKCHPRPLVR